MKTITKKNLVQKISQARGLHPTDVGNVIQSFLDQLIDCLSAGDRLEFRDFGVFEIVQRKQKIGRNPKKASVSIVIPARKVVKFTPGKKMREMVEHPSSSTHHVSSSSGSGVDKPSQGAHMAASERNLGL